MAEKKRGLGAKGLGINALINTEVQDLKTAKSNETVTELDLDLIEPNRKQPRKYFDETALEELAASLKAYGMIQPIVVKKNGEYYEIIAGERRWRAAKIAGMEKVPVVLKAWEGSEAFEAALVENLQREDLNPIEEAESYQRLQEEFQLSQEKIAEKVGKSRSAITNSLRLLQLDARVRNFVTENKLTGGHARSLLPVSDGDAQFELAEHIIEEGLSVRAVEALVKAYLAKEDAPAPAEKVVGKQNLFAKAYAEPRHAAKHVFRVRLARLDLRRHVHITDDRPRDELREHRHVQKELPVRPLHPNVFSVHID